MTTDAFYAKRPDPSNYAPYTEEYVSKVPDGNIIDTLRGQIDQVSAIFGSMTDREAGFRYAEGKWSLKQLVGHLTDVERVFVYRAMRMARADRQAMAGFDENDYVSAANFDKRSLADLLSEFVLVRKSTVAFFGTLAPEVWANVGTANDFTYSVRASAFVIAGHLEHHLRVIRERYLPHMAADA